MSQNARNFNLRYQKVIFGDNSTSGSVYVNFGLINEVKLTAKPINVGRDSFGRTVTGGYDVKGEFNIMAQDNDILRELFDAASVQGASSLKFYGIGGDVTLNNVLLSLDLEVNMDGKPSKIKASFDRYFTALEMQAAFLTTVTSTLPPVDVFSETDTSSIYETVQ